MVCSKTVTTKTATAEKNATGATNRFLHLLYFTQTHILRTSPDNGTTTINNP